MGYFSTTSKALAAAAVFIGFPAFAQSSSASSSAGANGSSTGSSSGSANVKGADMKFAHDAAIGGLEEVQLGTIASQKGGDQVKQMGQKLVDDHTKANDQLKSIAAKNNITLPTDLDSKAKAMVDKFSAMQSGPAFDAAYLKAMVADHTKDIAEFQKEADNGANPDLKSFAGSTLPVLQDHLKMAKQGGSMSGNMSSSNSARKM